MFDLDLKKEGQPSADAVVGSGLGCTWVRTDGWQYVRVAHDRSFTGQLHIGVSGICWPHPKTAGVETEAAFAVCRGEILGKPAP